MVGRKDATLREIYELVKDSVEEMTRRSVRLSFAFVFPNKEGRMVVRKVGEVDARSKGVDDERTLSSLQFQTGDFLDVAVL